MRPISFKRHRFPPDVIRYAVWFYFRFTLSVRDVRYFGLGPQCVALRRFGGPWKWTSKSLWLYRHAKRLRHSLCRQALCI
jgi:hypothetical protein